jgi:hypothetical protein
MMAVLLLINAGRVAHAQGTTSAPVVTAATTSSPAATPAATEGPASASSSGWGGCVNLKDKDPTIKIGTSTIVCLQIGNSVNWAGGVNYIRLSFTPETDQYSRFYVPNCTKTCNAMPCHAMKSFIGCVLSRVEHAYHLALASYLDRLIFLVHCLRLISSASAFANLVSNNTDTIWQSKNVTVGAASLQSLSFLKMYYNIQSKRIYPFLTAIINVHKGNITSITWDDACVFCSPSECEEITYDFNGNLQTPESSGQPTGGCYIPQDQCKSGATTGDTSSSSNPGANICDLMLYVVWSGTDASNRAFQSSNSRFSAFPPQNIQDRIKQLLPEIPSLGGRRRELMDVTSHRSSHFADGEAVLEVVPGEGGATVPEF